MLLTTHTLALLLAAASAAPDRILVNTVVPTLDESRPRVEAVAIMGGRVSVIGSTAEVHAPKGPQTEVIDLQGATVVPDREIPKTEILYAIVNGKIAYRAATK